MADVAVSYPSLGGTAAPSRMARVGAAAVPVRRWIAASLVLFLVAFPKGGFKVAGIPITWGYLLLVLPFGAFVWLLVRGAPLRVSRIRLLPLGTLIPFQLLAWSTLLVHGFVFPGFAVSLLVTFFFLPVTLLLAVGIHLDEMDLEPVFRWIGNAIVFAAVYGILLFCYTLVTKSFIEIPYLTMNAGDLGELGDKYNNRGGIWKLISTYNNGNLYGVSVLLLFPLFAQFERRPWRRGIVKLSLLLSLSRTVWLGLLLWEILDRVFVRGLSVKRLAGMAVALACAAGGIVFAITVLLDRPLTFLLDRNLGGRIGLEELPEAALLPDAAFTHIPELVYVGIINEFGVLGLFAYLLAMGFPLLLAATRAVPFAGGRMKRALFAALVIYSIVAAIDGAVLFIPVAAFYWFVVSLLVSDNPLLGTQPPAEGG